ncbi:MAG: phage portal protein [Mycobacterium sp.]|nr:phage portal protein [Mycobacterium sp.]
MKDVLQQLLQKLDEPAAKFAMLDRYYAGESPLAYLAPAAAEALGNRLRKVSVNIPRLLVDSVCERLRVVGFTGVDIWPDWQACGLDQTSRIAHREALTLGSSWAICWADRFGRPAVSIESSHQMAALIDPGTRQIQYAVKRWADDRHTHAVLYGPEEIVRYRANHTGATVDGFTAVESVANPLGVTPVVRFANPLRLLDECGTSEMADVLDLSDALMKLCTDMLVSSEMTARPRRWATGVEITTEVVRDDNGDPVLDGDGEPVMREVSPIPESHRAMISESPDARFGQIPGAELAGYENAIGVIMRAISAVSGLPEHMLGIGGDNPTSADSIRASEAALTSRAEQRQAQLGQGWEQVAKLMVAIRDGLDPSAVDAKVVWADASTRSLAAEADSVTKLFSVGLLPASYALKRLGYNETDLAEIAAARASEAPMPGVA